MPPAGAGRRCLMHHLTSIVSPARRIHVYHDGDPDAPAVLSQSGVVRMTFWLRDRHGGSGLLQACADSNYAGALMSFCNSTGIIALFLPMPPPYRSWSRTAPPMCSMCSPALHAVHEAWADVL